MYNVILKSAILNSIQKDSTYLNVESFERYIEAASDTECKQLTAWLRSKDVKAAYVNDTLYLFKGAHAIGLQKQAADGETSMPTWISDVDAEHLSPEDFSRSFEYPWFSRSGRGLDIYNGGENKPQEKTDEVMFLQASDSEEKYFDFKTNREIKEDDFYPAMTTSPSTLEQGKPWFYFKPEDISTAVRQLTAETQGDFAPVERYFTNTEPDAPVQKTPFNPDSKPKQINRDFQVSQDVPPTYSVETQPGFNMSMDRSDPNAIYASLTMTAGTQEIYDHGCIMVDLPKI